MGFYFFYFFRGVYEFVWVSPCVRTFAVCHKEKKMKLSVKSTWPPPPSYELTFLLLSLDLLFFFSPLSSQPALLLSIRAKAAQEQRSNLDLPLQLSVPSPAQTVSALYPISSPTRIEQRWTRVIPLVFMPVFFYQDATIVY